jgi:hypothetical protein
MDQAWIYDLARIDLMYLENVHQFVEEAKRHANSQNKNDIFYPCVDCENKIAWPDSKVVQSHEVDTGVRDNNFDGVFNGDDHDTVVDHDFDYEELLHHVEPHVLSSMVTQRRLSNMDILEKSSKDLLYNESNGHGKEFTQLRVILELLKLKAGQG